MLWTNWYFGGLFATFTGLLSSVTQCQCVVFIFDSNITNAILSYSLTILLTNKTVLSQKFTQI